MAGYQTYWLHLAYITVLHMLTYSRSLITCLFLIVLISHSETHSLAQMPGLRFARLGVPEGLPGHAVYDITKDSQEFMWFATDNGLSRFDGYDLVTYRPIPNDNTSLKDAFVTAVLEDESGILWVGTAQGGLHRFDPATESFLRYPVSPDSAHGTSHAFINDLMQTSDGTLWIGTDGGLDAFDGKQFIHYKYDEGGQGALRSPIVTDILEQPNQRLWIATHAGLHELDPKSGAIRVVELTGNNQPADTQLNVLFQDQSGLLWIGSDGGLVVMNPSTGTSERFLHVQENPSTLSSNRVHAITQDPEGILWIGTLGNDISDGLNRFDPQSGTSERYRMDPDDDFALSSNRVLSLFADENHMLWIGTHTHGLNLADLDGERIIRYSAGQAGRIPSNEVFSVHAATDGSVLVGTWSKGLARLDIDSGIASPIARLAGQNILDVFEDSDAYWIGTFDGLNSIDKHTGRIEKYVHDANDSSSLAGIAATAIERDQSGNLWVGSWGEGLSMMPAGSSQFERFTHDPNDPNSLPDQQVMKIEEDGRGILWYMSWDALYSYDHRSKRFQKLPVDHVNDFTFDDSGRLWIGTNDRGVVRYSFVDNTAYTFGTSKGLPHESVTGIINDRDGDIWAVTARGISRLSQSTGTFQNYVSNPLIRGNKLRLNRASRAPDGTLYFSSGNGLFRLHPDDFTSSQQQIPAKLTAIQIDGTEPDESTPFKWLGESASPDVYTLRYTQNDLTFQYAGLGYKKPGAYTYRYRLQPDEDSWVTPGTAREARYRNLSPGNYRFEVEAANQDGIWSNRPDVINILIRPPWWATPLAYIFYVFIVLGLFIGIVRYREIALNQRAMQLEEQVQVRTLALSKQKNQLESSQQIIQEQAERLIEHDKMKSRFFANISHEFRTPLTLILGPLRDVQRGVFGRISHKLLGQVHLMERNGRRLQTLINQLLELAKFESGVVKLEAESVDSVMLTRRIVRSFSSLAERKGIQLNMKTNWVNQEKNAIPELYVDVEKYEQILNNLISNALKFTPEGGKVDVVLGCHDDRFTIEVLDSGQGISEDDLSLVFDRFKQLHPREHHAEGSSGIGLALAKEWVTLHKGTIAVQNRAEGGASFTVQLPIGNAHLTPGEIIDKTSTQHGIQEMLPALDEFEFFTADEKTSYSNKSNLATVLLVEDNVDLRSYIQGHLATRYLVVEAVDGVDALQKANERRPDLVISDVMMPEMDGYALCREMKSNPDLADVPFILLTAKAEEEDKVEGLQTGADDYIFKPFSATELMVRAENLIDIRARLRQMYSNHIYEICPGDIDVESADSAFLLQVQDLVEQHIDNPNFGTDWLADEIGLSPRQFRRRIKALTRLSATGFIRTLRLQRAAQLLTQEAGTIAEIAYAVGFNDPKYFSRLFRQVYGVSPSEYEV